MTAAMAVGKRHPDRAEQLKALRRKIEAVSGKTGRGHSPTRRAVELLPEPDSLLPIPESLAERLPVALPRGSVVVASGARSLPLGVVAAVTGAGGHAAVVGQPDVGLLAAAEMGADLTRLALIPDPGTDPVEVAAVLLDGMDLVVLGLGGRSVPLSRGGGAGGGGGGGGGGPRRPPQQGLHATGHRWRLAGSDDPRGGPGLRLRHHRRRWRSARSGSRSDQPSAASRERGRSRRTGSPAGCSVSKSWPSGCWLFGAWIGPRSPRPPPRACPPPRRWRSRWPTG
jgi:hypothetical protein